VSEQEEFYIALSI